MTNRDIIKEKSETYNYIKLLAMILVVVGHVARLHTADSAIQIYASSEILASISRIIYGFHMPLFFLVSGAVYFFCLNDLGKYKNAKEFILKKTKRTIIPYLFFGFFYVCPTIYLLHMTDENLGVYLIKDIIFCSNSCHLWFLYYLYVYYIITYFVLRNKTNRWVMIALLALSLLNIKIISNYAAYYLFFLSGFYFNKYYSTLIKKIDRHKFKTIITIILLVILYIASQYLKIHQQIVYIIGVVMSLTTILTINNTRKNKTTNNILTKNSMGIYLFHPMIIYIIYYYLQSAVTASLFFNLITILAVIAISLSLTEITRKIKLGIIIGEDTARTNKTRQ